MLFGHMHFFGLVEDLAGPEGDSGGPSRVFCEMALQKSWQGPWRRHKPFPSWKMNI